MAKSNDFFRSFFYRYSYLAVTFKLADTSLLIKVTSYSNAVTCNALLQCPANCPPTHTQQQPQQLTQL